MWYKFIKKEKHEYHYFISKYNRSINVLECVGIKKKDVDRYLMNSPIRYCFITKQSEVLGLYSSEWDNIGFSLRADIREYIEKIEEEYTIKKRNENINNILNEI